MHEGEWWNRLDKGQISIQLADKESIGRETRLDFRKMSLKGIFQGWDKYFETLLDVIPEGKFWI